MADAIPGGGPMPVSQAVIDATPRRSVLGTFARTKLVRAALAGAALALLGKRQDIVRNALVGAVAVEGAYEAYDVLVVQNPDLRSHHARQAQSQPQGGAS